MKEEENLPSLNNDENLDYDGIPEAVQKRGLYIFFSREYIWTWVFVTDFVILSALGCIIYKH